MKLFIDECLSPSIAEDLNKSGQYDAVHPRDSGRMGDLDHVVLSKCLDEDRVIVTANAADFRALVGNEEIHPGLVIMPNAAKKLSMELMWKVLSHLEALGNPADLIVNHVIEIESDGKIEMYELPESTA